MKAWLSLHIYYEGSLDEILLQVLKPLIVGEQLQSYLYFYIRYWENGPHIRFRIFLEENKHFKIAKRLDEFYQSFKDEKKANIPSNRIELVEYEQEYLRYGGHEGMRVAQLHFTSSTEVCLNILEIFPNKMNILSIAQSLMLITIMVMDNNLKRALQFFDYYSKYYHVYEKQLGSKRSDFKEYCHTSYIDNEENLNNSILKVIKMLQEGKGSKLYQEWINVHLDIFEALTNLYHTGKLLHPITGKVPGIPDVGMQIELYSIITQSYIHMTNNRLGINPYEESLLAYYIARGLESFLENETGGLAENVEIN
ncbi:hypothetical protein D3C76_163180 [compost metagenome]